MRDRDRVYWDWGKNDKKREQVNKNKLTATKSTQNVEDGWATKGREKERKKEQNETDDKHKQIGF